LATEHLLEQGYRHIAHLAGPLAWWAARERKAGWEAALATAGLAPDASHCVEGNWSSRSAERSIERLLAQYPEMDAVFVANDQMALSVLHVAHRHGIRVPEELGVVGFDGLPESAYFWPPLTTVDQDQHELGCHAVQELVKMIGATRTGEPVAATAHLVFQPRLIQRRSSARLAAAA
ncbi:MAG TPA: substrate-binding domain-containing protein, partial [Ardenticatenaceae bacterium]|nr:substrate-binding domain-containing protein [Ardenticatenaceae bacterium]